VPQVGSPRPLEGLFKHLSQTLLQLCAILAVSDLTEKMDFGQRLDKVHRKVFQKFVPIIEQYLDQPGLQKVVPPPAGLAEAVTAIGMYESSRKIERYSKWLAVLTLVLIVLTAILLWRTFMP